MIGTAELLKVFAPLRGDALVIPGHAGRDWLQISNRPTRDVTLMPPPPMGGQAAFGCGLALAQPDEKVVLFDSEGNLQMNLGVLATIAEQAPKNFYHFLLDNECYATTGGQSGPNAKIINYGAIARGAGYPRAFAFDELEDFAENIASILALPGPVFVALKIVPEIDHKPIGQKGGWHPRTRAQVLQELREELRITE